jgi:peptide/nickel transport system substrate-binding protein
MESATAPDPRTFVVHWSAPFVNAYRAPGLTPMPRHLLESQYESDKTNLINSPYTTTQFVGLGPYRVAQWDQGSELLFTRFDQYYQGRPPLDSVNVKIIGDANALIANILAGAVDVILSEGADLDAVLEVKQRWEGTGNQVYILPFAPGSGLRHFEIQFRPEYAQPTRFGLADHTVRQAFYQSINRQNLTDIITRGYGPVADSWVPPYHALRPALESAIPPLPYDPARSQQLLTQAGWVRGNDGVLVHQQTGERFETTLYSSQGANVERAINVVADDWKTAGAVVNLSVIPIALGTDREYRSKLPGAGYTGGVGYDAFSADRLHSKFIAGPSNGWSGSNRGGFSNPQVDALIDRILVTIDQTQQIELQRQLLQAQMGDIAVMPLFWDIAVVPVLANVKGLDKGVWDIFHWQKV